MVFFRAFVMLACLIVVPLAAIFGSAFPEVVQTLLIDRIMGESHKTAPASAGGSSFDSGSAYAQSSGGASNISEAPPWSGSPATAAWPANGAGGQAPGIAASRSANIEPNNTASFASAVEAVPNRWPQNQVRQAGGSDAMGPAAVHNPTLTRPENSAGRQPGGSQPLTLAQPDRFETLERRLREYGATYYLLETWGNDGELYRFHCKMAVGNNPNFTQRFEATDSDALKAMAQVLEQVETWRAGRVQ